MSLNVEKPFRNRCDEGLRVTPLRLLLIPFPVPIVLVINLVKEFVWQLREVVDARGASDLKRKREGCQHNRRRWKTAENLQSDS